MSNLATRLDQIEKHLPGKDDGFEMRPFDHEAFRLAMLRDLSALTPAQLAKRADWLAYCEAMDKHFGESFDRRVLENLERKKQHEQSSHTT